MVTNETLGTFGALLARFSALKVSKKELLHCFSTSKTSENGIFKPEKRIKVAQKREFMIEKQQKNAVFVVIKASCETLLM
jgi:hypothetical protein